MKNRQIYTFFLPDLIPEGLLTDCTAVVIDILRATTTMTTGLANGATRIVPCVGVDQAHLVKQRLLDESSAFSGSDLPLAGVPTRRPSDLPANQAVKGLEIPPSHGPKSTGSPAIGHDLDGNTPPVLLGGERLGKPLPGFDLGNAPETYSPQAVAGKTIVMTTTNGTRAMDRCRGAGQILIGSFANLSRIVQHLQDVSRVALVCSGTDRHVTCEDVVFAGAVADQLLAAGLAGDRPWQLSDATKLAHCYWSSLPRSGRFPAEEAVLDLFQQSLGGTNLVAQGRAADLRFAAKIDRFDNLPVLDQVRWEIVNQL